MKFSSLISQLEPLGWEGESKSKLMGTGDEVIVIDEANDHPEQIAGPSCKAPTPTKASVKGVFDVDPHPTVQ